MASYGTVEPGVLYMPRPGGYAIVLDEGRIALVHTPRGYFLPGGGVEPDESIAEAAVRETTEETGLIIGITLEIGTADEYVHSPKYCEYFRKICTFFTAEVISHVEASEPDHDLIWTLPQEAVRLLTHGSQKWALEQLSSRPG